MSMLKRRTRGAFTLIELLVVIAIIAILAAILFPVFARAKDTAKKTQSLSNVKNLGTAHLLYNADFDDLFVPAVFDKVTDFLDYDSSWMRYLQPYIKNTQILISPNATNQQPLRPGVSSGGTIFSYAMLPRWQFYSGQAPSATSFWRTAFAPNGALMDGIGGFMFDPSGGYDGSYWGGSTACVSGRNPQNASVASLSQTAIARISETALVFDARGWEYGFGCRNNYPAPIDAMPPVLGPQFEGVNFEGRYTFEGVQVLNGVRYRIGTGTVVFADGSARALKTSQFFQTITTASGLPAYRFQYSQE